MGVVYALQTREFRASHEEARRATLNGETHEFPYGTYGMRVGHGAPVAEAPPAGARSVCAPGVVDAYGAPWSAEERQAATKEAMACAAEVADAEETLAARIALGAEDAVDRRAGPVEADEDGRAGPGALAKRVVLRGSTATARRRRRKTQAERAARERAEADDADDEFNDMPDPSPPPE